MSARAALEAALAAAPDDPAGHAAYADLLLEDGDPRGEYVRLQLALEDDDLPAARRRALENEAFALRSRYEADWLGPLAAFARPAAGPAVGAMTADPPAAVWWRRGWVDRIEVGVLTDDLRDAVAAAPIARLLRELVVRANGRPTGAGRRVQFSGLGPLAASPNVANLRRLALGDIDTWAFAIFDDDIGELVARAPRLGELRLVVARFAPARVFAADLPRLLALHVTSANRRLPVALLGRNRSLGRLRRLHLDTAEYLPADPDAVVEDRDPIFPDEVRTLFRSPHLTSLEHLALRLPGLADEGVDELVSSGMVGRLEGLDLIRCDVTDDGAATLAACPAVGKLKYLYLADNLMTPVGLDALARAGHPDVGTQRFGDVPLGWAERPDGDPGDAA